MVKNCYAAIGIILKTKPVIKQMKSSVHMPQRTIAWWVIYLLMFTISEIKVETFEKID